MTTHSQISTTHLNGAERKPDRLAQANALIAVIASNGRRFFRHKDRIAHMELRAGRIYFVDDFSGKAIYTHKTSFGNRWRGFSHGGTMRSLVEHLRDYITTGQLLPRWIIAPPYSSQPGDIWGYGAAAESVRSEAWALPMFEQPKFSADPARATGATQ